MLTQFFEIELTNTCNLDCIHCRVDRSNPRFLSLSIFERILCEIAEFPSKRKFVALSGGEPLLHPNFLEIVNQVAARGIEAHIVTNGTRLTPSVVNELLRVGREWLFFAISLDGPPEVHNRIRGDAQAFKKTVEAVRNLRAHDFDIAINFTLNDLNHTYVDAIYEICVGLGVKVLKVRMPIEFGKVHYDQQHFELWREYGKALRRAVTLSECSFKKHRIIVESNDPLWWCLNSNQGNRLRSRQGANWLGGCTAGWYQLHINHRGEVFPCAYLPYKLGDASQSSLAKILHENRRLIGRLMDRSQFEKCNDCAISRLCGGCRARAFLTNENLFGVDPLCPVGTPAWTC
jgi:radical SAM protein with 4Fe4S-binding SPASM domain